MTRRILLHVGYHKTATSWMQQELFKPVHGYRPVARHAEVFRHVVQPHGLAFDPAGMRDLIATRLAEAGDGDGGDGEVPVISSEMLVGNPFHGGQGSDVYAERLARIAPDARILISIRDQMRVLPSIYMQYLRRGGTRTPAAFFDGIDEWSYFGFSALHFEYDRLVAHYQRLFGAANVHVLTQESLAADMDAAAAAVADFAGNDAFDGLAPRARGVKYPSYPEHAAGLLRRVNQVQSSVLNPAPAIRLGETPGGLYRAVGGTLKQPWAKRILGARRPVSDHVRGRFAGRFGDSNARLQGIAAHPLALPGYEMPPGRSPVPPPPRP